MSEEGHEPHSVRELLTEMKNTSDWMIDLARAALLFESEEIAGHVRNFERRMDELMYQIRTIAAVAARNVEEARSITSILQVASAAEAISNSAGDMVDLVLRRMEIHPTIREAALLTDEKLANLRVEEGSALANRTLLDLELPSRIGVRILAVKRGKEWIVPPIASTELRAGDELVVKGPKDGLGVLCKMTGCPKLEFRGRGHLPKIGRKLSEMYDFSGMMVDMAYSSILLRSKEIAEEVRKLEEKFDKLNYSLWLETLKAAKVERNVRRLNSLLQVIKCLERISDAADSMADVVLRGMELHPVFAEAIAEADEQVARVKVSERSRLVGKTLRELNLEMSIGVDVIMIERGKRYIFNPSGMKKLRAGDSLVVRGTYFGIQRLREACGNGGGES